MTKNISNISLKELPARSEKLNPDQLKNVFGGCGERGAKCSKNFDCCSNLCSTNNGPSGHKQCLHVEW